MYRYLNSKAFLLKQTSKKNQRKIKQIIESINDYQSFNKKIQSIP